MRPGIVSLHNELKPTKAKPERRVYRLRWFGTDGKRYGDTIGVVGKMTKRQAEALCRKKQSEMDAGAIPRDKPRDMTLADFQKWHREEASLEVRESTLVEYDHSFAHAIKALGGGILINSLTVAHTSRVKKWLADSVPSQATARKTMKDLRAAFYRGLEHGLVATNVFVSKRVRRKRVVARKWSKEARIFEKAEIDQLVAGAEDLHLKALIKLAFTSGLRLGELCHLRWEDVELDGKAVTVRPRKAGTFMVDEAEYPVLPWVAKTDDSHRTVPIPDDTVTLLRRLQLASNGSIYLFITLDRLREIQSRAQAAQRRLVARPVRSCLERFKSLQRRVLGPGVKLGTMHDCRKTFCTLAAHEVPMHVLQEVAGHSNIKTTAEFYTVVRQSDEDAIRKAVGSGLRLVG